MNNVEDSDTYDAIYFLKIASFFAKNRCPYNRLTGPFEELSCSWVHLTLLNH